MSVLVFWTEVESSTSKVVEMLHQLQKLLMPLPQIAAVASRTFDHVFSFLSLEKVDKLIRQCVRKYVMSSYHDGLDIV